MPKGENLPLQRATGPETGGNKRKKRNEKGSHHGSDHDYTNDRNLCIFRSDGVFGKDRYDIRHRLHRISGGDSLIPADTGPYYLNTAIGGLRPDALTKSIPEKKFNIVARARPPIGDWAGYTNYRCGNLNIC